MGTFRYNYRIESGPSFTFRPESEWIMCEDHHPQLVTHDQRYIDYERFMRKVDPKIVKDFVNLVCSNFCIKNGRVVSIRFKNGIELQFFYNDEE